MLQPISFPAIRCHLGDWAYFNTVMPFNEVATRIERAQQINSNPGLDKMIQRELRPRVSEIADYLQTQPERFFSAIVVGIYGGDPDWFPVDIDDNREPQPSNFSEKARESVGILQLSGDEKLFAVDGQHRVEGIKAALAEDASLGTEEIAVLFVAHRDSPIGIARTRRLFTTLNKYAKPVTTSEIIALDEDDAFATVVRMVVNGYEGLNKTKQEHRRLLSLVKYEGAQIPTHDECSVTTIQMLYKLVYMLSHPKSDRKQRKELKRFRPHQDVIDGMYKDHLYFWEGLRMHVSAMRESLGSDPTKRVAMKFRNRTGGHVLFRPIGQEAFASALRVLMDRGIPMREGIEALASTRLSLTEAPWRNVMWDPSRNAMNRTSRKLSESLFLHMVHERPFDSKFQLEEEYHKAAGDPTSVFSGIPLGKPARHV